MLRGAADLETFKEWSKKGPIGKLHNIAIWVNRNNARRERLREKIQSVAELKNERKPLYHVLLSDGGVRWNSVYTMIVRGELQTIYLPTRHLLSLAFQLKDALTLLMLEMQRDRGNTTSEEYDITYDFITKDNWHELGRFRDLLTPFYNLTLKLQSKGGEGMEG